MLLFALTFACRNKDTVYDTGAGLDDSSPPERVDADGDSFYADEDCDDFNNTVYPGATEIPYNGVDDDCDEDSPDDDLDGDGYGFDEDCDDADDAVNPEAVEACNGLDDDCDGEADNAVGDLWYADYDGDGYGDLAVESQSCDGEEGTVADSTDCDDTDASIHPGADEDCDEDDDDCDGTVDEGVQSTFWQDADGDGWGTTELSTEACDVPTGFADNSGDCDDGDGAISPNATEICDDVDNDCDGDIDGDAVDAETWFLDGDGDGYGTSDTTETDCDPPSGYVDNDDDCDDSDATLNPDTVWYLDADEDGYGDADRTLASCEQPSGYVSDDTDCDDLDAEVAPWATFYEDADSDGYGDPDSTTEDCTAPRGYVEDDTDCDDDDATSYPGGTEVCDGADNDCDGTSDAGVLGSGEDCAAESCAAVLADDSSSTDGDYWLDPDGSGAAEWSCDMTTDGGGWTLIVDWDRQNDGDSQSDFENVFTANINNFTDWSAGGSYIQWSDYDATADVMDFEVEVIVPNDGDGLVDVDFDGVSYEDSAIYFSGETSTGQEEIWCRRYKDYSTTGWNAWSSTEQAYVPYTCSQTSTGSVSFSLTGTQYETLSAEIEAFHITALHYDINYGDYSRLYEVAFWVR